MKRLRALPVLMYHSVAPRGVLAPHGWLERLSVTVDLFEATLAEWNRRGIHTVGSDEIRGFLAGRVGLPQGSVALTFDDGYLDNWVAVTPLLRRYGHRAIVFVSTDFVDPRQVIRANLDGGVSPPTWQGYLSVPEMRAMVESGFVEIQSHARTHTWEFTSSKVIDFYGPHWNIEHPKCRYRFLWMNRHPELKPFAFDHLRRDAIPWGVPVYEFAPALVARRYLPDPELETHLVEEVAHAGGESFFSRPDWRSVLEREVEKHRARYGDRGRFETEEERRRRICHELAASRTFLEQATGRPVLFLSPPQGGADAETLELARNCGYDLVTAPSGGRLRLNRAGHGASWVYRCGTGYDLFGRGGSTAVSLRSQRFVLARSSAVPGAALLTRGVGAIRRLTGRPLDGPGR